jgi:archaellum biogenesis ATPase FlaH
MISNKEREEIRNRGRNEVNEEFGKLSSIRASDLVEIQKIKCGIEVLDSAIGGGIPVNRITCIDGGRKSGKTGIAMRYAASAGVPCLWFSYRAKFDSDRAKRLGVNAIEPCKVIKVDHVSEIHIFINNENLLNKFVVIDNLYLENIREHHLCDSLIRKITSIHNSLFKTCNSRTTIIICIPMHSFKEILSCYFASTVGIELTNRNVFRKENSKIYFRITKNKVGLPGSNGSFDVKEII